jgi:hypothetical protein
MARCAQNKTPSTACPRGPRAMICPSRRVSSLARKSTHLKHQRDMKLRILSSEKKRLIGRIATRLAPRKELKRPSLPRTPSRPRRAPQRFCQSELECRPEQSLWVAVGCAVADGWGALVLSIGKARSIVVTEPIQLRFHAFTRPPTKHTDELLLLPTFQQTCPDKTKFSGSQVQRYSLRLVFLPHIRFTAKSAAPVGSSCQSRLCSSARLINQKRAVLASAPLRAPLPSGD